MGKAKGASRTPSERAAAHRADLLAKGYRQKNLLVSPAALEALAKVTSREGCTEADAVQRALGYRAGNPPPGDG